MKTVFTNAMTAHVWAQQSQDHGRSAKGSLFFREDTIYSYGLHWPLAQIVTRGRGKTARKAVLIKNRYARGRSNTTSKRMGGVWRALPKGDNKLPEFDVEFLGPTGVGFRQAGLDHGANLASYTARRDEAIAKSMKTWLCYMSGQVWMARKWEQEYKAYCRFFGIRRKMPDRNGYGGKFAERLARGAIAEAEKERTDAIRVERARISYVAKRAEEAKKAMAFLPAWLAGEDIRANFYCLPDVHLRVKGDVIQTTQGAEFPVEHGIRAFPLIRAVMARGEAFVTNGRTIHLGHFTIDRIETDGTVKAGCHVVPWSSIERVAWQLGLMEDCRPMYAGGKGVE